MQANADGWLLQLTPGYSTIGDKQLAPRLDWSKHPAELEIEICPRPPPSPGKPEVLIVPNCVELLLAVKVSASQVFVLII